MYGSSIIQIHPHTAQKGCVIIKTAYKVRLRKDHRGVGLISHARPFGRLTTDFRCVPASQDRARIADDLMAVLFAIAVNFARSRDIDWQSAFLVEAVACFQARRIKVEAVSTFL